MDGGVGRPALERLAGVGPSVPVVSPGGKDRERGQEPRRRRGPRPPQTPPAGSEDRDGDDGSPGPETEEHRVDIVV